MQLRDELLSTCRAADHTAHDTVQALVDALMISIFVIAHDVDAAEHYNANITEAMRNGIRQGYREYHDMAESARSTRQ